MLTYLKLSNLKIGLLINLNTALIKDGINKGIAPIKCFAFYQLDNGCPAWLEYIVKMKFKIRFADQIVGLFMLIAILGIIGMLVMLGANQRWFAEDYLFWSTFKSAGGLSVGMPITLRGFEIGKVNTISLNPSNLVDIQFAIYDTYYHKVLPNSVLELASSPLGLGGGLILHPGKGQGAPISELSYIPSLDLENGKRLVAKGLVQIPEGEDLIGSVIGKIGPILDEIKETLVLVNGSISGKGEGPITEVLSSVADTVANVNSILAKLNTVLEDDVGDLLTDIQDLLRSVDTIAANLGETTGALRDPTGLVTTLLDPKGSIATLLDDDNQLFNRIVMAIADLSDIIANLSDFTKFINNTQPQITGILEKGRAAIDQSKDVLEAVKNNPLLRGGIPERKEQQTTFQSYRDEDF